MRMKKILIVGLLVLAALPVYALSTATQGVLGSLTISGCPGSQLVCFVQYSASNPLPVQLAITR